MKYEVDLQSKVSTSFYATLAAQSLDINTDEKSRHHFEVDADLSTSFNVGLIVGASGSGKTTLAKSIFGEFQNFLSKESAVIDQFPESWNYEQRANALTGIGLTAVPCWIKPAGALSNGQQARAEAALAMANGAQVIDEWTSVVDRTVAKAMSNCLQKYVRRENGKIVILSCHYDVIDWLNPDWIIDCNSQTFTRVVARRKDRLKFDVREVGKDAWSDLSKYHYLSQKLPGGKNYFYGLFHGSNQIGFVCFTNYIPQRAGTTMILHFNRLVIHPDYVGLSLGIRFLNIAAKEIQSQGFRVMGKFSSTPVYKALSKSPHWVLKTAKRVIGNQHQKNSGLSRINTIRSNLKIYSFEFV